MNELEITVYGAYWCPDYAVSPRMTRSIARSMAATPTIVATLTIREPFGAGCWDRFCLHS